MERGIKNRILFVGVIISKCKKITERRKGKKQTWRKKAGLTD